MCQQWSEQAGATLGLVEVPVMNIFIFKKCRTSKPFNSTPEVIRLILLTLLRVMVERCLFMPSIILKLLGFLFFGFFFFYANNFRLV